MALINCPECEKEISDKVKACPNCGYPMEDQGGESQESASEHPGKQEAQPVVLTSVQLGAKDPAKKKRALAVGGCALAVIAIAVAIILIVQSQSAKKARENYIDNLELIKIQMLYGAADAESVCNLTRSVWYNTIYEKSDITTDPFTKSDGVFYDDFNSSLLSLYFDEGIQATISEIKENRESVDEIMKELQNPDDEFVACYDTVTNMYTSYRNLTGLAISATGSLTSYTDNFHTHDTDFMSYYDKLTMLIPEK